MTPVRCIHPLGSKTYWSVTLAHSAFKDVLHTQPPSNFNGGNRLASEPAGCQCDSMQMGPLWKYPPTRPTSGAFQPRGRAMFEKKESYTLAEAKRTYDRLEHLVAEKTLSPR